MIARRRLKRLYFALASALGAAERTLKDIRARHRLVVLNLHRVRPEANPFWEPLAPELFDELLSFVTPRFRVTTFGRLLEAGDGRPPLVLSFDDGYHDFIEYAVPLLAKYRVPANLNVIGESILTGQAPAIVRLCDFLGAAPRTLIDRIRLPGFEPRLRFDTDEEKVRFGTALCNFLKMRPRAGAEPYWQLLAPVVEALDPFPASKMMTADEIRGVAGEHEIGCHSFGHDSMGFEDDAFFVRDFEQAERVFRDHIGLPIVVYAFPNGSWRASQVELLERREVRHVLLVGDDYSQPDAHVHSRFNFYADSPAEARLRALGFR